MANRFFEEMEKKGREYELKRSAHDKMKKDIVETYGWDSEELKEWYREKDTMKPPFTAGAAKAHRAWKYSPQEEVIMNDFLWDRERHDFIDTLRRAGIESFVTTNQSTGLMEDLHGYASEGCTLDGLCTITRCESHFGKEELKEIPGIRFKVN